MNTKTSFVDQIIQNRKLAHFLFWVMFIVSTTIMASLNTGYVKSHLFTNLALLPAQLMMSYALVYYLSPQLLLKRKYLPFFLSLLLCLYVTSVIARLMVIYVAEPLYRKDFEQESVLEILFDPLYLALSYFPPVFMTAFIFLSLKMIKDRFEEKHQLEVLQKEKATNELKFLKAQIHPHFLFNTLNNLYALTLTKSDAAPEVVIKLSELLDYILYQCNEPFVAVEKEVELIHNYIELEMLRYGEQLDLVFKHKIEDPQTQLAPLILLSFVENAFKHGASGNPINPVIHLDLTVQDSQLYFKVFNTKPNQQLQKSKSPERKGIGANNISRQLELNYPNKHQLTVADKEESYSVVLKIDLK